MSSRQMVFSAFPRSGPPPRFRDYADYAEVVGQLERTGCIADYTHIWWDIRPHPRLGTIEIRDLRRGHAGRGRRRDRRVLPGARQAALGALRRRRGDPDLPPHPDDREQVARGPLRARRAGHGSRHRHGATASRSRSSCAERCGRSSRTPASSARSASSRASSSCSTAATAPTASSGSSTRTTTSSRSSRRSRTRPSCCPRSAL